MEKGCPTAPQAGGLPSKNDPKTLEVLQKWIFEENAWCIQSKILTAAYGFSINAITTKNNRIW